MVFAVYRRNHDSPSFLTSLTGLSTGYQRKSAAGMNPCFRIDEARSGDPLGSSHSRASSGSTPRGSCRVYRPGLGRFQSRLRRSASRFASRGSGARSPISTVITEGAPQPYQLPPLPPVPPPAPLLPVPLPPVLLPGPGLPSDPLD